MLAVGCAMPPDGDGNTNDNDGEPVVFGADLTADQEPDPVDSNGSGSGSFTLNAERTQLEFDVMASGLSGPVIGAHFHVGPPGVSGGIVFNLGPFVVETAGTVLLVGTTTLADWDLADPVEALLDGEIYVNLHTDLGPAGELRGQLIPE
jgi:hypothetical protein